MKFNVFNKENKYSSIQEEWNTKGQKYAYEINEMINFGENNGWENWKGKEPVDSREHLAGKVIQLLRNANIENKVEEFRQNFPPAHSPFIKYFEEKGQPIDQIFFIEKKKIVFVVGYKNRQAYILDDYEIKRLDESIDSIGKSNKGNVFALQFGNKIITTKGWQGDMISKFEIKQNKDIEIKQLIPFNDGLRVLSITSQGIYLISQNNEDLIHPLLDLEDEEWDSFLSMENGTISNDNKYVVVGCQDSDHRVIDLDGNQIATIGPNHHIHTFAFSQKMIPN